MNGSNSPEVRKIQPYKITAGDRSFRKRVKEQRGARCEKCGKSELPERLAVHHILQTSIHPIHARTPDNVLVLCQECHQEITSNELSCAAAIGAFYAALPSKIRQRHLPFLESIRASPALLESFRGGDVRHWNSKAVDDLTR